jgi:hypothetical protein
VISGYGPSGFTTCTAPNQVLALVVLRRAPRTRQCVAVQVAFEKANLDTRISHFRFQGLKPGGFKLMGQLDSTCTAPPEERRGKENPRRALACLYSFYPPPPPRALSSSLWRGLPLPGVSDWLHGTYQNIGCHQLNRVLTAK